MPNLIVKVNVYLNLIVYKTPFKNNVRAGSGLN